MRYSTVFQAAAILAPFVNAGGVKVADLDHTHTRRTVRRCANDAPSERMIEQISKAAEADTSFSRTTLFSQGVSKCQRTIKVPTHFHVLVDSDAPDSYITEADLQSQLQAMNDAYNPHEVIFTLAGTTRSTNTAISTFTYDYGEDGIDGISGSPNLELEEYWKEHRTGDYKTLHVWLYAQMSDNLLGIATFPDAERLESEKWLDGIHVDANSIPGGSLAPYDLGITAVHEAGHWLGLFHVFDDGRSCEGTGDLVADTPVQSVATTGCPTSQDSCPDYPGVDSIHNYMDYSDDNCLTEFTEGQETRIHNIWTNVRAAVEW